MKHILLVLIILASCLTIACVSDEKFENETVYIASFGNTNGSFTIREIDNKISFWVKEPDGSNMIKYCPVGRSKFYYDSSWSDAHIIVEDNFCYFHVPNDTVIQSFEYPYAQQRYDENRGDNRRAGYNAIFLSGSV